VTKKRNGGNKMELIVATVNSIEISPYVSSGSCSDRPLKSLER
jgi:hypothetical protein